MQKVKTDTTVVPQGVVAAMKALREKTGSTEGKTMKILCTKNICFATILEQDRVLQMLVLGFYRPFNNINVFPKAFSL